MHENIVMSFEQCVHAYLAWSNPLRRFWWTHGSFDGAALRSEAFTESMAYKIPPDTLASVPTIHHWKKVQFHQLFNEFVHFGHFYRIISNKRESFTFLSTFNVGPVEKLFTWNVIEICCYVMFGMVYTFWVRSWCMMIELCNKIFQNYKLSMIFDKICEFYS